MVMYDNNMIMSLKQKKRKFEPSIKLNHNIYNRVRDSLNVTLPSVTGYLSMIDARLEFSRDHSTVPFEKIFNPSQEIRHLDVGLSQV